MLAHREISYHMKNMLLMNFVTTFASHATANSAWLTHRHHREVALAAGSSTARDALTLDSPSMKTFSRAGDNVSAAFCVLSMVF